MSNKQEATWHDGTEVQVGVPCSHGYVIRYNGPRKAYQGRAVHQGTGTLCDDPVHAKKECRAGTGVGEECTCKTQPRMAITEDPAFGESIPWEPQARPGQDVIELGLDEWVGQALGAASSCWSDLPNAGVFDSTRCKAISDALAKHVAGLMAAMVKEGERRRRVGEEYLQGLLKEAQSEPHLGLATTHSLLQELEVRFHVTNPHSQARQWMADLLESLPEETLEYRTVDDV